MIPRHPSGLLISIGGDSMAEEPRRGPPVVEIVLPTYITKPGEDEKFCPSEVNTIAQKVGRTAFGCLCFVALWVSEVRRV